MGSKSSRHTKANPEQFQERPLAQLPAHPPATVASERQQDLPTHGQPGPRAHLALQLLHQLRLPLLPLLVRLQLALVGCLLLLQPLAQLHVVLGHALTLRRLLLPGLQAQGLLQLRGVGRWIRPPAAGLGGGMDRRISAPNTPPPDLPIYGKEQESLSFMPKGSCSSLDWREL